MSFQLFASTSTLDTSRVTATNTYHLEILAISCMLSGLEDKSHMSIAFHACGGAEKASGEIFAGALGWGEGAETKVQDGQLCLDLTLFLDAKKDSK